MQKHLTKNKKALSSLALILLLLIAAIIGGLISYLWVTGYYLGLKEKIPEENTATITNLNFNPQNATAFNVTVLNPSFSPSESIQVYRITISAKDEGTLHAVQVTVPTLPINISRGSSQTFICKSEWTQYVNATVVISVFVTDGIGSISPIKLPYTNLILENYDFNPIIGVSNLTLTFKNDPQSVTFLNITKVSLRVTPPTADFTNLMQPSLPFALFPNSSQIFSCAYNWLNESRLGGSYFLDVETHQGYRFAFPVSIPQLGFSVQEIDFDPADTAHFNVTIRNQVSTNPYLNVSKIEARIGNNIFDATPSLSSSTNGVLGNSTATFICNWNWTAYRNQNVQVTVYMRQGIQTFGQKTTPQAAALSISENPVFPDTKHFFVTLQNSQYSIKAANITMIQVELDNGTTTVTTNPSLPYSLDKGNTTMFTCSWDWAGYLNRSVNILIYVDQGVFATFRAVRTPAIALNYQVYLSMPWANFTATDTTHFLVNVTNSASSDRSTNITRITVLLQDGTEIDATFTSQIIAINSTITFTCGWDWTTYRNKNVAIRVYTNEGLRAIYVTKTAP